MEPKRIALTGGIATGKSSVAILFRDLGAIIVDADLVAREAVAPGSLGWRRLRAHLGDSFFDTAGALDRQKLREAIIRDPACRRDIDSILHPLIFEAMEQRWEEWRRGDRINPLIFDIPLLFESGMESRFDIVILVYIPIDIQLLRLMQRDSLTRQAAEQTLTIQLPIDLKRAGAHLIIDNSGPFEETARQVRSVWDQLVAGSCASRH
ncbi:MAG: dephospho-CoA kinase [Syntrophobacteraceae bacterium]